MSEVLQSNAALSASSDVFSELLDPACNLAIWKRPPRQSFENLLRDDTRNLRFETDRKSLHQLLSQELREAGYSETAERNELIDDISLLADCYCRILDSVKFEVRLEVVTTNSCRKWHADYVNARLITTYAGSGTQWLCQEDVDRLGRGDEPLRINSMSPGDVGLFKGKLATKTPAIHRSPPIDGTGERRLLLVLNPPEEI